MAVPPKSSSGQIELGPKRKIAFVCSGGATKAGAFHLGVALALQEQGFKFFGGTIAPSGPPRIPGPMEISTYVGSSAGSIISSYLAAGYSLDNIFSSFLGRSSQKHLPRLTYSKMFTLKKNFAKETFNPLTQLKVVQEIFSHLKSGDWHALAKLKWLKTNGLFSTSGIEQYIREEVMPSNRFQDYLADLFIVATQLNHSRKVIFGKYSYEPPPYDVTCQYDNGVGISEACAASTALPLIYSPYAIKNHKGHSVHYIDGEIRDTLSTHVAADAGADLIFASYTHQPYHYVKEIGSLTQHGIPSIIIQAIYLVIEQKINNHIYNKQTQRNAITAVSQYCKDQSISEEHRHRICQIMEEQLHHRMDVDTIYIHPSASDSALFFGDHFTLSPKKMTEIARSGFRAAIETLKKYRFLDRKESPAMGSAS